MVTNSGARAIAIALNPNGILAPLHRILRESLNNVALGLHAVDQYETDVLPNLPTSFFHFRIGDREEKLTDAQLEALKERYRMWMLTTAFGEFTKAVFAALREAYLLCEVATSCRGTRKSLDEVRADIESIRTKAQKLALPTLVDGVSARLRAPLALREHVLSINKVRNCLEHRHGVVTKLDINDQANSALAVKWRRSKIFYEKDGREIEVTIGSIVEGPATVMHKFEDATKVFKLSERIRLTVDEFNEVMFTCYLLGQDIVSKLPALPAAPAAPP